MIVTMPKRVYRNRLLKRLLRPWFVTAWRVDPTEATVRVKLRRRKASR